MATQGLKLARAGYFLLAVAAIFFIAMMFLAPQSNDPVEVMRLSGQAAGVAAGIGIALIVADLFKRRKN